MRHRFALLLATLCLLSGCTANDGPPAEEAGAPREPDAIGSGEGPVTNVAPGEGEPLLQWNVTNGGDAAITLTVESDSTVACTLLARYAPGGGVGWDGMVLFSGAVEAWMVVGSTWHDVIVHAGPIDSRDVVEGYHDDSHMDLGWSWDNTGSVTILVAALHTAASEPGGPPSFVAGLDCAGDVALSDVAWGTEVLLHALTEADGAGAAVRDPAVGLVDLGAYASSTAATFAAPKVVGAVATLGSDTAVVDIAGPAPQRYVFPPGLESPPVEHFAGGPGDYTVTAAGGGPFSSAWTVLAGLTPLPAQVGQAQGT